MQTDPTITVLMPAYNAGCYIAEAIRSVLAQTYADFELVIVNDGSTDDTLNIINSFNDPRIRVINQNNLGVAAALNNGLKNARSPYIARFDADDICYPERLEKQLSFLEMNAGYVLVGSDVEYISAGGDHLFNFECIAHTHEEIIRKMYFYCPFVHPAVMYKKESIIKLGGYPENAHNFEDYLLWTNIAKAGKLYNLREPLVKYRLNPTSVTIDEKWRGKRFRNLKRNAVLRGAITPAEGEELMAIIKDQDTKQIRESAYHALCGKKFLTDNYQPQRSRGHFSRAIKIFPQRLDNYLLYTLSFLPQRLINFMHKLSPNRL
ncbi:glycosyltransferase [Mucilaginibacter calamicampi]|uniref:Glycosyltransferase n=1 Tax=Mucilaginibacter calamicampi TaxID=1302352 RepID=A0ABW2YYE4_9SPHI